LFPAANAAPLHVFVHGGYWQELSKDEAAFAAPGFLAAGAGFAAVNYGLAPMRSLSEMVSAVRRAIWWLSANAWQWHLDGSRLYVSGTSAGAHLVAMALLPGWVPDGRHPSELISGVTLLSGIYDLEPLVNTYINDALGLTESSAIENSPLRWLPHRLPETIASRGGGETRAFVHEHSRLLSALASRTRVRNVVCAERNHFDLPFDLSNPSSALGSAVFEQMGLPSADQGV
jgi:arylformamidase